jgi:hypothetical protein
MADSEDWRRAALAGGDLEFLDESKMTWKVGYYL